MKVYIKQLATGRYLKDSKSWTSDKSEALCFINSLSAIDFCLANEIRNTVILISFDDSRYDIELRAVS